MRRWIKNVVVPCSILLLGFVACGGSKKSGSGASGTDAGGTGGMSSSTSPGSGGASSSSDAGGSGGTQASGGSGGGANTDASGGTGGTLSEETGRSCETADDCYGAVDPLDLSGEIMCLDRVEGGYCTHECETDDDCCSVEGECNDDFTQVCGPFESTGLRLCFLSCEDEDILAVGSELDPDAFCEQNAGADFICRSTGGGQNNRRVCVPGDNTAGTGGAGGMGGEGGQAGANN